MKHAIFASAILPLATPLWADVIPLNAPVTAATLYSQGATLTRAVPFSAPAGSHELLITNLPESLDPLSVRVSLDGATMGAVTVRNERVYPSLQEDSPELTAAKSELEFLENDWQEVTDKRQDVLMASEVARARLAYLATLKGPTETASAAESFKEILTLIGQETLTAHREIAKAEREARLFDKQLEELEQPLADARQTVDALTPTESDDTMLVVAISSDVATDGTLTLTHLTPYAQWKPAYDVHLKDDDAPSMRIERGAFIAQYTDEDWSDVAMTLSTSRPDAQSQPSRLWPDRLYIEDKSPARPKTLSDQAEIGRMAAAPVLEPVVIEGAAAGYESFGDSINATYVYGLPVSVASEAEALRLSLDTLVTTPSIYALANPMRDETAFLMTEITNDSGEMVLPGTANFYRNGTYIGQEEIELIAVGATEDFSFGPINGLHLTDTVTDRITGDKGVLTTRNEQTETRIFTAKNLTSRDWDLRLIGRVPYSEQEDLVISHQTTPAASETNYDDNRGILMWSENVKAGQSFEVKLSHQIQWPTDKVLR